MDARHRDALLALGTCTLLIAISIRAETTATLVDPLAAVVGIIGTIVVESVLHRYHAATRAVWERRWVQVTAVVSIVGAAIVVVRTAVGATVLSVLVWGLLAYIGMLLLVEVRPQNPQS